MRHGAALNRNWGESKMTMRDFIRRNRKEIDDAIRRVLPGFGTDIRANDDERRLWIANDESLYNWARSEGVRV